MLCRYTLPDFLNVMKKLRSRHYWVDEDGELHRVSAARYQRIFDGTESIPLFAAKTVNFIGARVEVNEYAQEELVGADFPTHAFDVDGRWCREQKRKVFRGAAEMLLMWR